ncbi:hypothetical protein EXA18_06300 [Vibrio cincinnatiensis]|uniref:Acb2/Tad1 domain-containing protein n=1 Tax=Vibrio cincinnatiensis TaxID=675 RepID=UPI001EE134CB|nr:hypothetical protein [Vibrio cincinnatiensis]MCG3743099.1 hypothetical protein [Vibrio cincinnatiensis]
MENQHRKIKGYRELAKDEIDLMNQIKTKGEELHSLVESLKAVNASTGGHAIDLRWVDIGKTDLQTGIMALVRSVAMPETF